VSEDRLLALVENVPGVKMFIAAGLASFLAIAAPLFIARDSAVVRFANRFISTWLTRATAVLLLGRGVLSGLQIILRNVLQSGLLWIDPLLRHSVLLLTFLGALAATGGKRHLHIDVLGRLLQGAVARAVGAGIALLGAAICLALAHASFSLLAEEIPTGEIAFLGVPTWNVIAVFPVAFLGMAFRMSLLALEEAAGVAAHAVTHDAPDAGGVATRAPVGGDRRTVAMSAPWGGGGVLSPGRMEREPAHR
jgi:TRAP-type C4-dicarboxylate transport system permease small subunit